MSTQVKYSPVDERMFLAGLHAECQEWIFGEQFTLGEIGAGDFARWLSIRERRNEDGCRVPITQFDIISALNIFEDWAKAPFNETAF